MIKDKNGNEIKVGDYISRGNDMLFVTRVVEATGDIRVEQYLDKSEIEAYYEIVAAE